MADEAVRRLPTPADADPLHGIGAEALHEEGGLGATPSCTASSVVTAIAMSAVRSMASWTASCIRRARNSSLDGCWMSRPLRAVRVASPCALRTACAWASRMAYVLSSTMRRSAVRVMEGC